MSRASGRIEKGKEGELQNPFSCHRTDYLMPEAVQGSFQFGDLPSKCDLTE
jgi:hypothetical protein